MRREIRLISNKTPEFIVIVEEESFNNYWEEDEKKVIGFDALWAHVDIPIAKKEKGNIENIKVNQVSDQNLSKISKSKNHYIDVSF